MANDGGLRALFKRKLPDFFWTPVESGGTQSGVPDSYYVYGGVAGWVEFKKREERSSHSVKFRPHQIPWHTLHHKAGGISFIAVRDESIAEGRDDLYLFAGFAIDHVRQHGLRCDSGLLIRSSGGPRKWDWSAVQALLAFPR